MGNLNRYNETYNKAKKQANLKERIEKVTNYLFDNIDKENISNIIKKMEEAIYE